MPELAPSPASADRNLLFGILALQMDFVSRDALLAAMNAWVLAKHKPLGAILVEQGGLAPEEHACFGTTWVRLPYFGMSSATPSAPCRSIPTGWPGRAAPSPAWPRPPTTSATCPRATWTPPASPSWPTPWKRPAAPTPSCWGTSVVPDPTFEGAGQST